MIKTRLSSPALADRGARLAGVGFIDRLVPRQVGAVDYEFPTACPPPHAVGAAAPDAPPPASGAGFFQSCPVAPTSGQDIAPAVTAPAAGAVSFFAVELPEHVMVLVNAIAAYEQCSMERAATLALVDYATKVGAGPLARAVLDLCEGGDLADVPAHAGNGTNRFRGGGP